MPRPLRVQKKDAIYFVTNRCLHQKFFLRPSEDVNAIILGLLAQMAERHDIEIFAFVFMSNHFHLMVRARSLNLHVFMREFQGMLARRLNRHWGRTGRFYERRYTSTEILGDDAIADKLRYTVCNPCESDLVSHPKLWPGLSSWNCHKTGEVLEGKIVNRDLYWSLKRKKGNEGLSESELIELATEKYPLEMAKLPMWENLDDETYRNTVCKHIRDYALELTEQRKRPCLGVKAILAQRFDKSPNNPKKEPRPVCHTNCPKTRKAYLEELWLVTDRYQGAVGKLREGKSEVEFPAGTIPPGHLYCVGAPGARAGPTRP